MSPPARPGVDAVVEALDDLVERTAEGSERLDLDVLRAAFLAKGRERAA